MNCWEVGRLTSNEIKDLYSMHDIAARYGIQPNRSGFIPCPFHRGDREPSMKLYERDFHCHACGANGDIFTFVQLMESVDFKAAFQILGGVYEKPTFASRMKVYKAQKQREMKRKQIERLKERKQLNNLLIAVFRTHMARSEPFSDVWADCCNALQYQLYIHEELNRAEER